MSAAHGVLTLYFDGACPLCSREARFYGERAPLGRIAFVDIAAADFDAAAHGLNAVAIHRQIHGRTADGRLVVGIDALAQMWSLLPRSRWLAVLTRIPGIRQLMQMGYWAFARLRPHLPGRARAGERPACGMRRPS
jgi:predicted DCC family thiol-disulfide oxidoreductase YuxK